MTTPKVETTWVGYDRWYVRRDGEGSQQVPGVSAIIGMMPKPALLNWKARATAEYAVDHLDMLRQVKQDDGRDAAVELAKNATVRSTRAAAAEGTDIHASAEAVYLAMIGKRRPSFTATPRELRYLRNLARFVAEFDVDPLMVETTVWSTEHDYAGTFDFMGRLRALDDELCIVDTKSGASGVWPEAGLQQTAYKWAGHYIDPDGDLKPMPKVARTYGLWLRPEGWALIPLRSDEVMWEQFLRLRGTYRWTKEVERSVCGKPLNAQPLKRKGRW